MSLATFKLWASQTGIDALTIAEIDVYRSRKPPWHHEFLVFRLSPRPDVFPSPEASLPDVSSGFDLLENLRRGLQFRVERGRASESGSNPTIHTRQAAVDSITLMQHDQLLHNSDPLFTLRNERSSSTSPALKFPAPRVFDLHSCLQFTLEILGPDYHLLHKNCWYFAAHVFTFMSFFFWTGAMKVIPKYKDGDKTSDDSLRKRFGGLYFSDPNFLFKFPRIRAAFEGNESNNTL
jgi:hypothetical protein